MYTKRSKRTGRWNGGAALWQPQIVHPHRRPPPVPTNPMEIEDDSDFHDYQPQEETNYLASVEDTTETSTQSGPMTLPSIVLPHIPLPTLVPRRGLLVIRWLWKMFLITSIVFLPQRVRLISVDKETGCWTCLCHNCNKVQLKTIFFTWKCLKQLPWPIYLLVRKYMHVTLDFHQLNRIGLPQNANFAVFLHPTVLTLGYIRRAEIWQFLIFLGRSTAHLFVPVDF